MIQSMTMFALSETEVLSPSSLLKSYFPILLVSFAVAVVLTPIIRWAAREAGIVDHPDEARKLHVKPIAYLGGFAILFATLVGIGLSFTGVVDLPTMMKPVPYAIVVGMIAIAFTGFIDDVWSSYSWHKTAGQLVAAAAMASQGIGTTVARGFLNGVGIPKGFSEFVLPYTPILFADTITPEYIIGVIIIAMFILGACNAANFIDGLDGLLSGVVAITAIGILAITLFALEALTPEQITVNYLGEGTTLLGANIVLCMAVLGAVLGFLIYNFNPASIFLGDTGSLLLGYLCIVMVLLLGERGQTHLVIAGLIVFALPIIDAALAITRRKMAGKPISEPDANHIHHLLMKKYGSVKKAVFVLYGMSALFAIVGVTLAWVHLSVEVGAWFIYVIAALMFGFIGIKAIRYARKFE
jgi:UDP-GlcNAc:undecaprenyl-phosphate GlcNAc-1-phosphate transferase